MRQFIKRRRQFFQFLGLAALFVLALPALAQADLPASQPAPLLLSKVQMISIALGALVPLVGYLLNSSVFKQVPETVKAAVHVAIATAVGAIITAVDTHVIGFNWPTIQLVVSAIVAAFGAHALVWKPSGVQAVLTGRSTTKAGRTDG